MRIGTRPPTQRSEIKNRAPAREWARLLLDRAPDRKSSFTTPMSDPLLMAALDSPIAALEKNGWHPLLARRIALGQLILSLEKPDGQLDWAAARKRFGSAFEETLLHVKAGPKVRALGEYVLSEREPKIDSRYDDGFQKHIATTADRLTANRMNKWRFQAPALPPSPNWQASSPPGTLLGVVETFLSRDCSSLLDGEGRLRLPPDLAWSDGARELEEKLQARIDEAWAYGRTPFEGAFPLAVARIFHELQGDSVEQRAANGGDALDALIGQATGFPSRYRTRVEELNWAPSRLLSAAEGSVQLGMPDAGIYAHPFVDALLKEQRARQAPMSVLDRLADRLGTADLFRGTAVLNRGHLMDTTVELQKVIDSGPSLFLAKPYSHNALVARELRRDGHSVAVLNDTGGWPGMPGAELVEAQRAAIERNPNAYFFGQFTTVVPRWLKEIGTQDAPIHLLDDGAEAILYLSHAHPELASRTTAVEQTRSGANKLKSVELDFPVVNVAESSLKLVMESVLIGWSLAAEIERQIVDWESLGIERGQKMVLLGYGAVGRATAQCLRAQGFELEIYDEDPAKMAQARAEGFVTPAKAAALASADYVLGATGKTSLTRGDFVGIKNGAKLFTLSSSTVEFAVGGEGLAVKQPHRFDRVYYSDFQGIEVPVGPSNDHASLVITLLDREFLAANSLFPINFLGGPHTLRPEYIQVTRALLYLGSVVAKTLPPGSKGLIDLNSTELGRKEQLAIAADFINEMRALSPEVLPPYILAMLEEAYREVQKELGR